jgi:hypothetical protein
MKITPSATAGTKDFSMTMTVHLGRTFSVRIKQTFDPADLQGKNKIVFTFSEKGLLPAYFFRRGCSIALEFPIDIGL